MAFPRGSNLVKSSQDDRHVADEEKETLNINVEGKNWKDIERIKKTYKMYQTTQMDQKSDQTPKKKFAKQKKQISSTSKQ